VLTRKTEVELRTLYDNEKTYQRDIDDLQYQNDAKLCHIRRLHVAISNLGVRHPMTYAMQDWDELCHELPTMVSKIDNINNKLKELELERDRIKAQEHESEEESVTGAVPSVPKPPPAVGTSKPRSSEKDKAKEQAGKKKKEHRKSADGRTSSKVRSPSPTSSETSKANTGRTVRRPSKSVHHTGSGFFFGA
jgi:hypothetical protein